MRPQLLISLSCFSLMLYANDEGQQHEIQLRIQPVGQVTVQGQSKSSIKSTDISDSQVNSGQKIYDRYCVVCHKGGLAGAPRFRNEQDWKSRLAQKKINDLVASSLKGLNAMPAKGTCIKCSENDLKEAISYMLPKS